MAVYTVIPAQGGKDVDPGFAVRPPDLVSHLQAVREPASKDKGGCLSMLLPLLPPAPSLSHAEVETVTPAGRTWVA